MPTLVSEPSLYPDDLLDGFSVEESERYWCAVYTKPRQEKSLARQLIAHEIPVYLPLEARHSVVNGRRKKSYLPLFRSYVFVFADGQEKLQVLETKRVVQMFAAPDAGELTRDLRNLRTLVASGLPLTVEDHLAVGKPVRVKAGALMGVEGIIVSCRGQHRLIVAVQFLQQGVSILFDDFQVEPL